ncbi:hypothetical protein GmRootA79_40610 [Acidovorax sp. A79]|uniref:hypothetical protein n=1 Tax=Acidovorax sp. A79 TaxID=3056107 RepID=UPI0034E8C2CF
MSAYASLMEIILIEEKVSKNPNPKTGQLTTWKEARAIVRKEDGSVATVGMFRVPAVLEGQVGLGLYSVGFTLGVRDYGDSAGRIEAQFVSLTPVDSKLISRAAAAPSPAVSKAS